jgi:hypothetical protein
MKPHNEELIESMRLSKSTRFALPPAAAVCAYLWCVRPWYLRWGASEEESGMALHLRLSTPADSGVTAADGGSGR